MKLLVVYSSCDGQTLKIAKHIVGKLRTSFEQVNYVNLADTPVEQVQLAGYDKVIIGASIRYGKFRPHLYDFLSLYREVLAKLPCVFFGVCLTARKAEKATPETNLYMKKLKLNAVWLPENQAVFAGALLYSRYNWWQTRLIQLIMKITGGSTDTSKDIELTDWAKVDEFALKVEKLS